MLKRFFDLLDICFIIVNISLTIIYFFYNLSYLVEIPFALSTGYFNEHSHTEFFNYEILENTINKIMLMLTDPDSRKFEYIEKIAGTYCDFCNGHSSTLKPYTIMGTNDKVYLCKSCYQMLKEHLSHD